MKMDKIKNFCENWNNNHDIMNGLSFFYDKYQIIDILNDIYDRDNDKLFIDEYNYNIKFVDSLNNMILIDISYIDDVMYLIDIDNKQMYVTQISKFQKCDNVFHKNYGIGLELKNNGFDCNNVNEFLNYITGGEII